DNDVALYDAVGEQADDLQVNAAWRVGADVQLVAEAEFKTVRRRVAIEYSGDNWLTVFIKAQIGVKQLPILIPLACACFGRRGRRRGRPEEVAVFGQLGRGSKDARLRWLVKVEAAGVFAVV